MATLASIGINITGDSQELSKAIASATERMETFAKRAGEVGRTLSTRLTLPIVGLGAVAVKAASDAEETFSKFDTVFRDVAKSADQSFRTLRDQYGLSSKASKQLLSDTGDLLTGFGFSQQSALDLATEVNKLAVDLASFTNFSGGAEGASQALTKALLGERESVKSLGIAILEEDVQKRVAINTTRGLTFETERQAKAYATLQIAQEQSKNAIGDYARTQDSFANQTRLLQARLGDLAVEFGQVMLPTLQRMVRATGGIVESFRGLDDRTKGVIVAIAGMTAVIGPALIGIGALTKAFIALRAATIAHPILAIATAIGAIGTAAYLAMGGVSDLKKEVMEQVGIEDGLTGAKEEQVKLYARVVELSEKLTAEQRNLASLGMDAVEERVRSQKRIEGLRGQIVATTELLNESRKLAQVNEQASGTAPVAPESVETVEHLSGSIDALRAKIETMTTRFNATADVAERFNLSEQIKEANAELDRMESLLKGVDMGMDELTARPDLNALPMSLDEVNAQLAEYERLLGQARTQDERDNILSLVSALQELRNAFMGLSGAPPVINEINTQLIVARELADTFTSSFGAGLANVIVQGEKLGDVLKNIGKLLLSSAIQQGIKFLLLGSAGFGVAGGTTGIIGSLFGGASASPVAGSALSMDGAFRLQGTDLVLAINRSERTFR